MLPRLCAGGIYRMIWRGSSTALLPQGYGLWDVAQASGRWCSRRTLRKHKHWSWSGSQTNKGHFFEIMTLIILNLKSLILPEKLWKQYSNWPSGAIYCRILWETATQNRRKTGCEYADLVAMATKSAHMWWNLHPSLTDLKKKIIF